MTVRVLEVVGGLDPGGTETWLLHALRGIDRREFRLDFLVHSPAGAYEDEVRALGAAVIRCPSPRAPWRYAPRFLRILREHGPYDVVHAHLHHYSGLVLWLAAAAGVPARIAHSHTDARDEPAQALRRLYLRASRALLRRSATRGLAASEAAAAALFGEGWREDPRVSVLHCGLDLAPCRREYDRAAVRAELGLPDGALVVGHVGRFVPEKNHAFLLQVVVELLRIEPRTQALLVGDGPLRDATARRARELGLADRVIFAGLRRDVPRLMRAAMDVFVFPSRFEGLGLAVVEAQAAGLPSVVSDGVPREVEETGSVRFLPLSAPASAWARAARDAAAARAPVPRSSRFDVTESIDRLSAVYREHAHRV